MDLSEVAGAQGNAQNSQEEAAKQAQEEQTRRDLLATVLDTGARERCTYDFHGLCIPDLVLESEQCQESLS